MTREPAFDLTPIRQQYPFKQHYFDRGGGIDLQYIDEGRGDAPPLVMVHGNPTWSFYYRRLVRAFKDDFHCIVPDHVGCGLSDKPGVDRYDYRLRSRIDDLEALLEHTGVRKNVTLVLHDWGGAIGMGWAARHPDRVKRIVLLNTAAFGLPKTKAFPWPIWIFKALPFGEWLARRCNGFAVAAALSAAHKPLPARLRRGFLAPYNSWNNRIATYRFVEDIPLTPADPSWGDIQTITAALAQFVDRPALMCWGQRDFVFDHHFLTEWRRHWPHAEVHAWSDAGHYVLEDAGTRVIEAMRKFFLRHR